MRISPQLILLALSIALSASGRDRGQAAGSAIAPRLTLASGPVSASATASLRACITNDQPFSNAQLATGDTLRLTLSDGVLVACALEASSPAVGNDADWACGIEGQSIELSYLGAPRAWAPEELRCLRIDWVAPSATTTLRFESQPVLAGRMAPAEPATLVVPISATSGGGGGVGARVHLRSTGCASAVTGEPPAVVPGLDATLVVAEGSHVAAWIDSVPQGGGSITWSTQPYLVLLVDGLVVARQPFVGHSFATIDQVAAHLSFMTPTLSAGTHRFQVGVDMPDSAPGTLSPCMGSFNPARASRLTLLEIQAD